MAGHVATSRSAALTVTNTEDTAVNAGFSGSKPGQRKKPFKRNPPGPSSLNRILDRSCQIHGTPEQPANHTNRDCWVFKQAGKLSVENRDKGLHSDDEEEPRPPNNRGQKGFPPQVRTVNMTYATHIPKGSRNMLLRTSMHWSQSPQSSTHGPPARSLLIEGTTPLAFVTADSQHWS